ncbi:ABC transporter permease [Marinactinospora rubrisoli]|uniref:ABC transporter permease n=1 Tax=Marinactinospora rubrisoli TaxID=2715399 RepID=A0ABW2KAP4_9ACTN
MSGRAPRRHRRTPDWGRYLTWAVLCWLFTPVGFVVLFGFNDITGRQNVTWQGFTLRWYGRVFDYPDLTTALLATAAVGALTMVISGVVGGLLGLALGRHRFRGRGATDLVLFLAICAPEVVIGAALLSLFLTLNIATGFATVVVAHVAFTVSYVAVTVRVRVMTLDPRLEEAARDLGAGPWTTFRLVTLPALLPAVTAGGLLALALSVDDFVITSFVRGDVTTFPLWVWGATRAGVPPQVNVMGTVVFVAGVLLAVGNVLLPFTRHGGSLPARRRR